MSDYELQNISRATFDKMDTDTKLGVLFDISVTTHGEVKFLMKHRRGKFFDKVYSTIGGIIGGFIAVVVSKWW